MEEKIYFQCPNPACNKRLKATRAQAGRSAQCSCGQRVVVPEHTTLPVEEPPRPSVKQEVASAGPAAPPPPAPDPPAPEGQAASGGLLKTFFGAPQIRHRIREGVTPVHAEANGRSAVVAQTPPANVHLIGNITPDGEQSWLEVTLADGRKGFIDSSLPQIWVHDPVTIRRPSCFRFLCPWCNWLLRARLAHRGQKGKCPTCSMEIEVPRQVAPVSLGCAFFLFALPFAIVLLVLGVAVAGYLGGPAAAGIAAIAGLVLGLAGGGVLGVLNAKKNGVIMNDWVTNDPVLSTEHDVLNALRGEAGRPVEMAAAEGSGSESAKKAGEPPFEFRPGRWGTLGCGLFGVLGIVPGLIFGLQHWHEAQQKPDFNPLTDGIIISLVVGFFGGFLVVGFFGWGLGLMVGCVAELIKKSPSEYTTSAAGGPVANELPIDPQG